MGAWSTGFGYVVIDGQRYERDVVVCGTRVFERPKYLSKRYGARFDHTPLSKEEVEAILAMCPDAELVIVGTGQYGALPVPSDSLETMRAKGVKVVVAKTPDALEKLRESWGGKVLAVLHVTC